MSDSFALIRHKALRLDANKEYDPFKCAEMDFTE
jgi:hypothetical protein